MRLQVKDVRLGVAPEFNMKGVKGVLSPEKLKLTFITVYVRFISAHFPRSAETKPIEAFQRFPPQWAKLNRYTNRNISTDNGRIDICPGRHKAQCLSETLIISVQSSTSHLPYGSQFGGGNVHWFLSPLTSDFLFNWVQNVCDLDINRSYLVL